MENPLKEWQELHRFYKYSGYLTKELAEYIGVSTRTIQRWMKGKNNPPEAKIKKIEAFLRNKKEKQAASQKSDI